MRLWFFHLTNYINLTLIVVTRYGTSHTMWRRLKSLRIHFWLHLHFDMYSFHQETILLLAKFCNQEILYETLLCILIICFLFLLVFSISVLPIPRSVTEETVWLMADLARQFKTVYLRGMPMKWEKKTMARLILGTPVPFLFFLIYFILLNNVINFSIPKMSIETLC